MKKHVDRLSQELKIGDVVIVCAECYSRIDDSRNQQEIGIIEELKPKSVNILIESRMNSLYSINARYSSRIIKLPPTEENRQLLFEGLNLDENMKEKLLTMITEYDKG